MLTIRDAQVTAFKRASTKGFTERMVAHIAEEFPISYRQLGEDGTRLFVTEAIQKAAGFNVFGQGPVASYIELTLDFGKSFERSPDRVWAHSMLAHPMLPDIVKMDAIRQRLTAITDGRRIIQRLPEPPKGG